MDKATRNGERLCDGCNKPTEEVYIKCHECSDTYICMMCFSTGIEFGCHLKTHKYQIQDEGSFVIFDPRWNGMEETVLLDNIEQYGLGNWEDVAKNIPQKTAKDIELHYNKAYVESIIGNVFIPAEIPNRMTDHTPPIHESILSIQPPVISTSKEDLLKLAYMPSRDDYEYEYDNEAENIVCNLYDDNDADETEKALLSSQVSIYLDRLKERQRRKDICREYKLVDKFFSKNNEEAGMKKYERELRIKLRPCSQFMKSDQFDLFIATMIREKHLKRKIQQLRNYRMNGIKRLADCNAYDAAVFKRNKRKEAQGGATATGKKNDSNKLLSDTDETTTPCGQSLRSDPLCKLLSGNERQLCHALKITPTRYAGYKAILIKDNIVKKHDVRIRMKASNQIQKVHRRHVVAYLKDQGWMS